MPDTHSPVVENVCGDMREGTCCSREMLAGMAEASEHELRRILNNLLEKTAENFRNDTIILKSFVTDTLGSTMEQLHNQLRTDFSYKFRAHEQFLINFFSTIQSYLSGTVGDLPHLVSSFFDELLWRITQILLNTNSTDTYTKCVIDSLRSKQPFLRIPSIITNMTMEAFPPIRAAINSMAFARETLLAASITIHPSHECFAEYQRLRFCSLCVGVINANLCESTCLQLAEMCTPEQLALGTQWKKFIGALQEIMNLVDKFPKVHRPLQMHLTDAIMNLKSVYTLHEQEILSNCSLQGGNFTISRSDDSGRGGGDPWSYSGHRRVRRQSPPAFYQSSVIYQQPTGPLRPHAFEARPLPTVALGEQGITSLQAWARAVKHRYDKVAHFFENLGLGICNSGKPLFGGNFAPSNTCWNGTSLVSSMAAQLNVHQSQSARPTDPTLRQKELGLQRAVISLQHVASSTLADPEVLQLADPAATTLKVGRNEVPVNSDEEALRSYLVPSGSTEASWISLEAHNAAAAVPSLWGAQPPPPGTPLNSGSISRVGFEPDTERSEGGSGYGGEEMPLPYGSHFAIPSENDPNNQLLQFPSASHPFPPVAAPSESTATTRRPLPMQPTNNFVSGGDDEDFRPRIENSGYEPMNVYGFPEPLQSEATQPAWPNQPQSPFDATPGVPLTHWDTGSESPEEGSGREPIGAQLGIKPMPEWTGAPQPPQQHPSAPSSPTPSQPQPPAQTGDAGLVVGEGKLDIPDQIWVPEGDGVAHQYPDPSHLRTTSGVPAPAPFFVSSLFSMVPFLLHVALHASGAANYTALGLVEKYSNIQLEVRRALDSLDLITRWHDYMVKREQRFRQTTNAINWKIFVAGILQILLLLALGYWQILSLKSYFIAKKLV
ncbi:Glypican-4 [Taenia crassiceps]|uniref:Glypican-4 n=1 Tax=Taenia crassiceps TaxID=6207 RepID=A0ABR4QU68_9CEST